MDPILRAACVYVALFLLFRIAGQRTLKEVTTFDLVLLLIISEATQQALVGNDYSLTTCLLVIITLVLMDVGFSILKQRSKTIDHLMDGRPVIMVKDGRMFHEKMNKERVDEGDIMESAREHHGLERMEQIRYAVLERNGVITVIPKE